MDIVVRNAFLPQRREKVDIGIYREKIVRISGNIKEPGRTEIDAEGGVVFPGFVDPHVHMDKSLIRQRLKGKRDLSTLDKRISATQEIKRSFTEEDVKERIIRAARMVVPRGTLVTRTHVEADPIVEFKCVRGALQAKKDCREIIDIQTIAFPQEGWVRSEDGSELESCPFIREAMEKGMDVVGGNVNRLIWESDPEAQVDELFEIARRRDADIDMHLDNSDNAVAFTLPYVCKKTVEAGYHGRVTVSHIPSLAAVPDHVAKRTIEQVREAGIHVCVLPIRIRLTRVWELIHAGVNVTCGTDNMQDVFTGLGSGDVLQAMLLLAHITRTGFDDDLETIFRLGTVNAARALRIENDYGIEEGKRADVVILEAESVPEAIRNQSARKAVIKRGRLVAERGHLKDPQQLFPR